MKIVELEDAGNDRENGMGSDQIVKVDAKRALVGAGARILFYPTLLYNVLRNKMEAEFRWWDEIDQRYGIDHLKIPTRDYCFAPKFSDISRAVDFIHRNALCGKTTYVHCKAGRGRSTTIVLCYLVKYKHMTPSAALEYVRSRRPRVLLAPSQWEAVQEYSNRRPVASSSPPSGGDAVLITKDDLEGYHGTCIDSAGRELAVGPWMGKSKPMIARLSCLFSSLIVHGSSGSLMKRLPVSEARAC